MKPARTLLVPAVALIAFFLARGLLGAEDAVNRVTNLGSFLLATVGAAAAALAFERGDYLRGAWFYQALSSAALFVPALWRGPGESHALALLRVGFILGANVFSVMGTALFARAHAVAGLELPWSRGARRAFIALVALLALAAAGPPIIIDVPPALRGDLEAWVGIISSVADLIVLALIAPLFMTAVALRGGLLAWPWALLTASTFCWLLYDAQDTVTYFIPSLTEDPLTIVTIPLRVLASATAFGAAWIQRQVTIGDAVGG